MANTVIALKKSATISSTPTSLEFGELAINYADGKIFYKNVNSSIVEFAPSTGGGGGNSFGTVNANSTLVIADTAGDILTLLAGNNISITGDAVNDTITFSANIAPAFDKANSAETIAIAAFDKANTGGGGSSNTLPVLISEYKFIGDGSTFSYTLGTGAYSNNVLVFINGVAQPNSAYTFVDANTTAILSEIPAEYDTLFFKVISGSAGDGGGTQDDTIANTAFDKANVANVIASSSFNKANAANVIASGAFDKANAANVIAVAAFNKANTPANSTFISSNTTNAAAGVTLTTTANGISFTDGNFATAGDAVVNHYILRGITTSTAEVELLVDGTTRIPVRTNSTMMYTVDAVGRRTDATGYGAAITIKGAADNFAGTTADIGTIYEVVVARDSSFYTIDARSNNTTDVLNIYAAGATGNTVRWVAYVTTVEVSQ